MRTIAVANQKGGCGKTTTSVNLAVAFAKRGYRVLAVDVDPQGHATLGLGCNPDELDISLYEALTNSQIPMSKVVRRTYMSGVSLVPSNVLLSGAEVELASLFRREFVLRDQLAGMADLYDVCFIDCSPSLGLLTLNALAACGEVLIPVQTHYYALEGLRQLLETINIVKERFNRKLQIAGVLLTFVEGRVNLSRDVQRQLREFFGDLVFSTVIHRNTRLAEAPSAGESVITFDEGSRGAIEYMQLAEEVSNGKTKKRTTQESLIDF
ncbi:MAG: ParA family protein [Planctomycetota bacterium]|jgi:chromosome partitioning protein